MLGYQYRAVWFRGVPLREEMVEKINVGQIIDEVMGRKELRYNKMRK